METSSGNAEQVLIIRDTTANPAPLGLLGFGMTTVLLNLHNAGSFELNAMIMGMGIFVGGIAQIFAGLQEWKKGNNFFNSVYCIWLILAFARSFMVNPQNLIWRRL